MTIIEKQGPYFAPSNVAMRRPGSEDLSSFSLVSDEQPKQRSHGSLESGGAISKFADSLWSLSVDGLTPSPEADLDEKDDLAAEIHRWANMDVGEKIRAQYLASRGLTEDDLANMSADDRKAIEDEIKKTIEEASGTDQAVRQVAMQFPSDIGQDPRGQSDQKSPHHDKLRNSPEDTEKDGI